MQYRLIISFMGCVYCRKEENGELFCCKRCLPLAVMEEINQWSVTSRIVALVLKRLPYQTRNTCESVESARTRIPQRIFIFREEQQFALCGI
jgi:hypothetical protein